MAVLREVAGIATEISYIYFKGNIMKTEDLSLEIDNLDIEQLEITDFVANDNVEGEDVSKVMSASCTTCVCTCSCIVPV